MANPLKKAAIYLGLADEEEIDYASEMTNAVTTPIQTTNRAPVTALPRRTSVRESVASDMNEIVTLHPQKYADARIIAENFREGVPVIMNLTQMPEEDARRLIDFASGLSLGLYGRIERVTSKVFLLSPVHVSVSGEGAANTAEVDNTFFAG
jgi:cell division inhibitor SepF